VSLERQRNKVAATQTTLSYSKGSKRPTVISQLLSLFTIVVNGESTVYDVGDLVTYRKDLLGVEGHIGIVVNAFYDNDKVYYITVRWLDGEVYPELGKHIILLARAKSS